MDQAHATTQLVNPVLGIGANLKYLILRSEITTKLESAIGFGDHHKGVLLQYAAQ